MSGLISVPPESDRELELGTFPDVVASGLPADSETRQVKQQKALSQVIGQIRTSLDVDTIFNTTAIEVRRLLRADRVGVFRFHADRDGIGELVAEDVEAGFRSALHQPVQDHCFKSQFEPLYRQGRVNAIGDIYAANYADCYLKVLEQFQIRANIVAPLIQGDELWGLLCIHQCDGPRQWTDTDIDFVAQVAEHLSVALQHCDLLLQAQRQVEQQKAMTGVISRIRKSLNLNEIFTTTATEVRQLLKTDRVAIFRFYPDRDWEGEVIAESVVEAWPSAKNTPVHDHCFKGQFAPLYKEGRINAIADIYAENYEDCYIKVLEQFQIRANVVAPLLKGEELWGLLCVHQCGEPRQWAEPEIEFIGQIADHLGVALTQTDYISQVQTQATQLAAAVEQEREVERQRALNQTIDKIRQSLKLESIFKTVTDELLELLHVERAGIYRFNSDWSGEFVAEAMLGDWTPLLGQKVADTYLQETDGGRYQNNESFVVDDIYDAGHKPCHIEILERFQAKAYMIAPILKGARLWGLLAVYQNSSTRHWYPSEVTSLTYIGTQLGNALQQAEYLNRIEKASERQRALLKTIDKIRQSLDINTIFETTTQEVRQFLEVERVAIYRFYEDWSGDFVADSLAPDVVNAKVNCLPSISFTQQEQLTGTYPRNETFVPISQGDKLWGLLVASQLSQPRYWQEEEINLLAQIGAQLGVALRQAELHEQTRQQTQDLTQALQDLQMSQAQLIQGEKMASLGQLVAGVAHEINNPVNFIHGNLRHVDGYVEELLQLVDLYGKHYPQPAEEIQAVIDEMDLDFTQQDLPKTLDSMKLGTQRIREIVLSLRNFSRLDEDGKKAANLHEGLDNTLLILQHRLAQSRDGAPVGIEVLKEYGQVPLVNCFPAQLNQVFMNIICNAIDAIESDVDNPKISIQTEVVGSDISISIRDNGPGMPEAVRSQLFDPFFTTKPVGKGTGLGLSISYQIITEKHGGELLCQAAPDQGTEFIIKIPMQAPS